MKHISLIIIVVAFTALATVYSLVMPLGEGPDEPGHARYVFFLAKTGRLPVQGSTPNKSDAPGEGHQPPLAYALMAPLVAWLPVDARQFDLPANARFTWAGGSELNAVAHGSHEYLPWSGFVLAWHLARLGAVALGAATVVFTYAAARALERRLEIGDWRLSNGQSPISNPQSLIPLLAAALVAFNPQFLFVSALVTNDALLVTLSAALLWLVLRGPRTKNKEQRTENREPRTENQEQRTENRELENREPRTENQGPTISMAVKHAILIGLVLGLALITKQNALLLAPVALVSVLEQSWLAERKRHADRRSAIFSARHLVALAIFAAVTLLVCGWWYARNARLYGDIFGLAVFQAEFATQPFVAGSLAAWAGALAQLHASFWARFGWMNVPPPDWVIWFFTIIEVIGLAGLIRLGVATQGKDSRRLKPRLRSLRLTVPLRGQWRLLRPRRGTIGGTPLRRGFNRRPNVRRPNLAWSVLAIGWPLLALPLLACAWVVSFALTTGLVAWQGRLLFPALPAITILLACGLAAWQNREPRTENRIWSKILGFLVLGSWFLLALWLPFGVIRPAYPFHTLPAATALAQLVTPVYGRFMTAGELGAELRGWRIDGPVRPGDTPELTLMWFARSRQDRNWTVFIHLVDDQEQIVAQDNQPPQTGAFPMKQWVAGDWVEDRHTLALPAGLTPGSYHLRVGLFDPRTQRRPGVYSQRNKLVGDFVDLGPIVVGR